MRGEEIAYLGINERGEEGVHFAAVMHYPDGAPLVTDRPQRVDRVLLRPKSMVAFLGGLFWLESVAHREAIGLGFEVILPLVPGSRQDRWNESGDALFTAKSVARIINAYEINAITVVDPHSDVTPALIDNCKVIHTADFVPAEMASRYSAVISPDAGAEKRAAAVARKLAVPVIRAWKTRDVATGKISGFGIEPWNQTGTVLVVDDICDGGGTFVGLAELLKVPADLFVTHGLFTKGTQELLEHYTRIYCTDSVVLARLGVSIVPVCQQLLEKGSL